MKQNNFAVQQASTAVAANLKNNQKSNRFSGSMALLGGVFMMCTALFSGKANAQAIATYTGTGGTSTSITYVANETGTVLQKVGYGTNSPCASGGLSGMTNNGVTTYSATNAHAYFQILPNSGFQINVTSFSVKLRRSGSGLTKVRFAYSLDGGTTWTDNGIDAAPDNTSCGGGSTVFTWGSVALPTAITSTTNGVIFGLYAYAPISSGGVFQINSIVVNGSVNAAGSCTTTPAAGTASASPATLCGSGTSVLTLTGGSAAPGVTYQWQSASALAGPYANIAGATNATYTASVSTTTYYRVNSTCSFGGTTATSSVSSVAVNPAPAAITGTTTFTQGATTTLSDVTGGGTWSSSDTLTAKVNASTGVVTGVASGTATIFYTVGGCSVSTVVTVTARAFASCPSNLIVLTANGTSSAATAVTLREYDRNTLNQTSPISADGIPSTGAGQLTISGSASTEGHLALNADWTKIIFAGYDAPAGTASIATAANINRKIYSVSSLAINTQVASDSQRTTYKTDAIRSAVASGSNYYASGTSSTAGTAGIQLCGATTSTQVCATTTNTRVVNIFNGQLYYTTASAAGMGLPLGLYAVGTGIPTSIAAATNVVDAALGGGVTTPSPLGFSVSPDGNTVYIADDRSTAEKGIYKFTRSGSTWSYAYKLANGAGARSLVVDYSTIPYATVYATTASGSSTTRDTLIKIIDSNATATYVKLATSDSGTSFRGVTFAPGCCAKIYAITNTTICNGNTVKFVLYGNPGGRVTYSDGSSNFTVTLNASGTDTITVTPSAATTYSLVSIHTSACDSALISGSFDVTVNDVPSVDAPGTETGDTVVCAGATIQVGDAFPGGTWSSSDTTIATVDPATGLVTGVAAGVANIRYSVTNSCGTTTVSINILVITAPTAGVSGPSTVAVSGVISLTGTPASGTWSSFNDLVATVDPVTGDVTGVSADTVTIFYSVTNACGTSVATYLIDVTSGNGQKGSAHSTVGTTGVAAISMYPNPANATLNVVAGETVNVSILSVDGKELMHINNAKSINVSDLATGVYIIKIANSENVVIKTAQFTKN